jgi:hypothetical protein
MLTFKQLWENHPTVKGEENPCGSEFTNQCAIKLGTALSRAGVKSIPGVHTCWLKEHKGAGHYLLAEELANGLRRASIPGILPVKEIPSKNFQANILGRTGIIFFRDYWQRNINGKVELFRNRSGDHIDLWNGSRLTQLSSWARIHIRVSNLGMHSIPLFGVSDLEDSRAIWFWSVL